MGKVILDITMSLDGYIAGNNDGIELPLGEEGQRLHDWIFSAKTHVDAEILEEAMESTGAVIMGRCTFDIVDTTHAWEEGPHAEVPYFVLTHEVPREVLTGHVEFTFITDGLQSALSQAKLVAGDRNVTIMGGAAVAQQFLEANMVDEIRLHLAHILLGKGKRLFGEDSPAVPLQRLRLVESAAVTHFWFQVMK